MASKVKGSIRESVCMDFVKIQDGVWVTLDNVALGLFGTLGPFFFDMS